MSLVQSRRFLMANTYFKRRKLMAASEAHILYKLNGKEYISISLTTDTVRVTGCFSKTYITKVLITCLSLRIIYFCEDIAKATFCIKFDRVSNFFLADIILVIDIQISFSMKHPTNTLKYSKENQGLMMSLC